MPNQVGKRGGIKLRRSSKDKSYYEGGFRRTEINKHRRSQKRAAKIAYWRTEGVKKNGQPVRLAKPKDTK